MKKIWVDVETTGLLCGKDRIIELAAIYEDEIFHMYCKPFESKPENFGFIEELTGITWEYLEEKGCSDQELYREFNNWLCKIINRYDHLDKAVYCAFNAHFDSDFIRALFNRNGNKFYGSFFFSARLDVMTTVAENVDKLYTLPNFKNETVCNHLGIELKAHSALEDIKSTRELYNRLSK